VTRHELQDRLWDYLAEYVVNYFIGTELKDKYKIRGYATYNDGDSIIARITTNKGNNYKIDFSISMLLSVFIMDKALRSVLEDVAGTMKFQINKWFKKIEEEENGS